MGTIQYHLGELEIALNEGDARHVLPVVLESDRALLDIGCGIGQSLVALGCADRLRVGMDVDASAIAYAIEHYGAQIQFVVSDAKRIPFPADTFDLVFCRVSLPYTNIPAVIGEIARVLRTGGRVWMTLHDHGRARRELDEAIAARSLRRIAHRIYVLANGHLLRQFGRVLPYLNGRYESWQDTAAMVTLLARNGFDVAVRREGRHDVIEGRLVRGAADPVAEDTPPG